MIDPVNVILGVGDLALAAIAGAAIWSSRKWQHAHSDAQDKAIAAEGERDLWKTIAKDNGADAHRLASEASALRARLRGFEALVPPEPKLIRIPKGQPGAGRFIPNPKLKAELTA